MKTGIIRLINKKTEEEVCIDHYTYKWQRKKIIERWQKLYGKGLRKFWLQIYVPERNIEKELIKKLEAA